MRSFLPPEFSILAIEPIEDPSPINNVGRFNILFKNSSRFKIRLPFDLNSIYKLVTKLEKTSH